MPQASHPDVAPHTRVAQLLALYGDPRMSVAALLCDAHPVDSIAYTVVEADLTSRTLTYGELREASERFAAALAELGIAPGDRVATLMGKSVDFLIALLGIWRLGAVHVPLFTAFGRPAIATRLVGSGAKVVICDAVQRVKLQAGDDIPDPAPWRVIITDAEQEGTAAEDLDFAALVDAHEPGFPAVALGGDAPLIHIYTSGTTGKPKGVIVPSKALAGFQIYAEYALELRRDDVYWCAADPGWAYGLYFGILGSFTTGVPSVLLHAGFSPESTWAVLEKFQVTNLAAAPTVYRAMRAADAVIPGGLRLRCASSAGEPLTPEVNEWAETALGVHVCDHYGQTEAGMLINNHHHPALERPVREGSMGHAMPGWSMRVLYEDTDEVAPVGTLGRIAADITASPLAWFDGYDGDQAKSAEKFTADRRWYLTGDAGSVDNDGYFHFSARDDDVIIMAGYRIGPFEVESVLAAHPAVVESAVIAVPDAIRGEVLEAFVVPRPGWQTSAGLAADLQQLVKTNFAAHAYPRAVHFVDELPKTPSGKIQRFVLRQQRRCEMSLPSS
jgi:acetyl-CoA synthetase